ncbi:MAG: ParB N-terminal domain-containing protein [Brevundimonas sp.]|uniref:ParB/RepB/Spo0J family partition protein n=1 Tax=Brevundimonas sp. TaxID=1871086 RepID=UPI00273672DC|nr:ParB N-terminal domain-containing protein [Brevundimonas sp.]MDP3405074.1 ParB N-terminal domain-containing protein [Brevundimonas sp.]
MTANAFENAALLRRLADQDARPIASIRGLADELGRDPSNLRKSFKALAGDSVLDWPQGEVPTLTDLGRQTLRGIDVAQGRDTADAPAAVPTRWPIAAMRPNPGNRTIDPDGIDDLAASIVALGDIIQPLVLTPPDADGVRMILAGERRWRAASRLAAGTTMEGLAIAAGLPFVEREATAAEALQLAIIENSQREGVSPLEDARMLLRLQQMTGWNGVELAIQLGRADRENKSGAKDVQDKLKIAREATPEAIAAYEATGSWDDLRNSVRTKREQQGEPSPIPTGPYVVNGVDYLNATRAQEARYALGIDQRPAPNYGSAAPSSPAAAPRHPREGGDNGPKEISRRAAMALVELADKIHIDRRALDPASDPSWSGDADADYLAFGATAGAYWLDAAFSELQSERLVRAAHQTGGTPPMAALTPTGVHWLKLAGVPLPPPPAAVARYRDVAGVPTGQVPVGSWATDWLANPVRPAATPEQPELIESTPEEIAQRKAASREEEAEIAARSLNRAFAQQTGDWMNFARFRGQSDYLSDPDLSAEDLAVEVMRALATAELHRAAAALAVLHERGVNVYRPTLTRMPVSVVTTAMTAARETHGETASEAA